MTEHVYRVPDINCAHCVNAITKELSNINGVANIDVNLEAKSVTVQADESVTDEQLRAGIDEAGFDVAA